MHRSSLHIHFSAFLFVPSFTSVHTLIFPTTKPNRFTFLMSQGQMDETTRAMCYALRNPGPGKSPTKLKDIRKMVFKKDGRTRPTLAAIALAASTFKEEKSKRGRKQGQRLTSKDEDRKILNTFKKLRPPGHGIDSNVLKKALPKKLRTKVSRRTIIRRLAEQGYHPEKKEARLT